MYYLPDGHYDLLSTFLFKVKLTDSSKKVVNVFVLSALNISLRLFGFFTFCKINLFSVTDATPEFWCETENSFCCLFEVGFFFLSQEGNILLIGRINNFLFSLATQSMTFVFFNPI